MQKTLTMGEIVTIAVVMVSSILSIGATVDQLHTLKSDVRDVQTGINIMDGKLYTINQRLATLEGKTSATREAKNMPENQTPHQIRITKETHDQLQAMKPDIEQAKRAIQALDELGIDTRALKERVQWADQAIQILGENFGPEK